MVALDWTSFFDDEQSMLSLNKVSFDACWLGKYNEANEGHHASYPGSECICIPLENRGLPQIPLTPAGNYPLLVVPGTIQEVQHQDGGRRKAGKLGRAPVEVTGKTAYGHAIGK